MLAVAPGVGARFSLGLRFWQACQI
jgi:hypothetical protein